MARTRSTASGQVIQGNGSAVPATATRPKSSAPPKSRTRRASPSIPPTATSMSTRATGSSASTQPASGLLGPTPAPAELSNSSSVAVGGDGSLYANNTTPSGANVAAFAPLVTGAGTEHRQPGRSSTPSTMPAPATPPTSRSRRAATTRRSRPRSRSPATTTTATPRSSATTRPATRSTAPPATRPTPGRPAMRRWPPTGSA